MRELGRILSRRRLILALALILLLNGLLFIREQRENDYGLDLELPGGGFIFAEGTFTATQEPVDAWAASRRYAQWLERVRGLSPNDAGAALKDEKEVLAERLAGDGETEEDRLDYVAVNNLLRRTDYLAGYGEWLETIQKNKENLLTFSLFNDPNSFSGRNIFKTAGEFEKLRGVELTLGADGAVEAFMTFPLTDYFLVLALLLMGLSFLEERKAGLWSVIHAAPRGRLRLAARRTAILCGASVVGVLLLYGTNLALGFAIYGGTDDLGRAVQSVQALGRLPMLTTVGGFLVRYFLLRMAAAFLIALILWLMLTAVNNVKYTVIAAAGVLAAEYSLYTFLPVQSVFNILKYFNLFTYISLSDLYVNYLNIDVFGFPVGIRGVSQLALLPLCLLLTAACVALQCLKKPTEGRDLLGRAAYKINSVTDRFLRRLRLLGMELHKTLWIQKGVIAAALLVYVAVGLSYTTPVPVTSLAEQAAREYTAMFAGPVTGETFDRMDGERKRLDNDLDAYEDAKKAFADGLMEYPELDVYARKADTAQIKSEGLSKVRARCEELRARGEREGFAPWLLDETPFESVYGSCAEYNQRQAALTAVLALTLLLGGSMAYERQSGMTYLLRSTPRGRGALILRKLLLAAAMASSVWAVVYGLEVYTLLTGFDIPAWSAPARNLSMLPAFPLRCSVAGWLALLYLLRWAALFFCGAVVLLISSLAKRLEIACVASCAVMLIPSVLYAYMGIGVFRPLAVLQTVEAMPLLLEANGAFSAIWPWFAALATVAAAATLRLFAPKRGR